MSQIRSIRKKMIQIITRDVSSSILREMVIKLLPDSMAKDIEKACNIIYPLNNVIIRKVSYSVFYKSILILLNK